MPQSPEGILCQHFLFNILQISISETSNYESNISQTSISQKRTSLNKYFHCRNRCCLSVWCCMVMTISSQRGGGADVHATSLAMSLPSFNSGLFSLKLQTIQT